MAPGCIPLSPTFSRVPHEAKHHRPIAKSLKGLGESQLAIAEATGINQGNLSKFLRGERSLSLETFALLCENLRLTLVAK
jgi:hypothetical protein